MSEETTRGLLKEAWIRLVLAGLAEKGQLGERIEAHLKSPIVNAFDYGYDQGYEAGIAQERRDQEAFRVSPIQEMSNVHR